MRPRPMSAPWIAQLPCASLASAIAPMPTAESPVETPGFSRRQSLRRVRLLSFLGNSLLVNS
jgi:hypothetical protein